LITLGGAGFSPSPVLAHTPPWNPEPSRPSPSHGSSPIHDTKRDPEPVLLLLGQALDVVLEHVGLYAPSLPY